MLKKELILFLQIESGITKIIAIIINFLAKCPILVQELALFSNFYYYTIKMSSS